MKDGGDGSGGGARLGVQDLKGTKTRIHGAGSPEQVTLKENGV